MRCLKQLSIYSGESRYPLELRRHVLPSSKLKIFSCSRLVHSKSNKEDQRRLSKNCSTLKTTPFLNVCRNQIRLRRYLRQCMIDVCECETQRNTRGIHAIFVFDLSSPFRTVLLPFNEQVCNGMCSSGAVDVGEYRTLI